MIAGLCACLLIMALAAAIAGFIAAIALPWQSRWRAIGERAMYVGCLSTVLILLAIALMEVWI